MASRRMISADLGGTKRLAGTLDRGLSVHHRVQRTDVGFDRSAVLTAAIHVLADVCEEAVGAIDAIGVRIPSGRRWEPVL